MMLKTKDCDGARIFTTTKMMAASCCIALFAAYLPEVGGAPQEQPVISDAWETASPAEGPALIANGAGIRDTLWSNMVVPYENTGVNAAKLKAALQMWKAVGFKFVNYNPSQHDEWVRLIPKGGYASSSQIGRRGKGVATETRISGFASPGHIAHELGHALGLKHELIRHSPIDRDNYVTIDWENIIDGEEYNFTKLNTVWTPGCSGPVSACLTGTPVAGIELGGYDYNSIMHYGSNDFGRVSVIESISTGFACLALGPAALAVPACLKKESYTAKVLTGKSPHVPNTIVANRAGLTTHDKAKTKQLYNTYAFSCGAMAVAKTQAITSPQGTFTQVNLPGCNKNKYEWYDFGYKDFIATIKAVSPTQMPAGDYDLTLVTPAPNGGSKSLTANNPGGDKTRLLLTPATLLPGSQSLIFSNLETSFADYTLTYEIKPASIPPDTFDAQNKGNTINAPQGLGTLSKSPFFSTKAIKGLTIHTINDVDYFQVTLPAPDQYETSCGITGSKGSHGQSLIDGKVEIRVTRQDLHRVVRTVVYRYDASGNIMPNPTKAHRPWRFNKKASIIECPHAEYANRPIVFSFEDCSGGANQTTGQCNKSKHHFYDISVTYTPTTEWYDPDLLWIAQQKLKADTQVLPEHPDPDLPITAYQLEWYLNQGHLMMGVMSQYLGVESELLHAIGEHGLFFEPGALNRAYAILRTYDGDEPLDEPVQMLEYIAAKGEQLQLAEDIETEMFESGELPSAEDIGEPEPEMGDARWVSEVLIEDIANWVDLEFTLFGEQAYPNGVGESMLGFFRLPDGKVTQIGYKLVDGIAFHHSDVALDLAAQIPDGWWKPGVNTLWQWQLGGDGLDTSLVADMYAIDYEETTAETVTALHDSGRQAVCHISVGSWENWRGDAARFPDIVLGNDYEGSTGERWLDIRRIDLLSPILEARMDMCRDKGFDGIEPDNMDTYTKDTGFPLTGQDQLAFNLWLARAAHERDLSIGMKNDSDQAAQLWPHFDWALTEDCFDQGWCADMEPFIAAGKPVFAAEYTDTGITLTDFCSDAVIMGFRGILKDRDLTVWRQSCDGNTIYTEGDVSVPSQTISVGNSLTWAATGAVTTNGNLTINSGATLNLRGPEHILNPGLRINVGAWFRASR